jgi:hypothetical protein
MITMATRLKKARGIALGFQFVAVAALIYALVICCIGLAEGHVLIGAIGIVVVAFASFGIGLRTRFRLKQFRETP